MKKWEKLILNGDETADNIVSELIGKGYKLSDWIIDISTRLNSKLNNEYDIWLVSLKDLGFSGPTKLQDVYEQLKINGFSPLPPEIGLMLRMSYDNQPAAEWVRIATPLNSMIDRDGIPHLPKLGSGLGNLYLETYWSWPEAIFHPHNEFLVQKVTK
tara:strand:+ start:583 stop:1053 length:471 start_codon:yes stop_codon:yes gene_type:complete